MSKLTLYLRRPIQGKNSINGVSVAYTLDRIHCAPVGEGEEPDTPDMIDALHAGVVDENGAAVPIAELRRWKLREGVIEAYRQTVWNGSDAPTFEEKKA